MPAAASSQDLELGTPSRRQDPEHSRRQRARSRAGHAVVPVVVFRKNCSCYHIFAWICLDLLSIFAIRGKWWYGNSEYLIATFAIQNWEIERFILAMNMSASKGMKQMPWTLAGVWHLFLPFEAELFMGSGEWISHCHLCQIKLRLSCCHEQVNLERHEAYGMYTCWSTVACASAFRGWGLHG